MEELEILRAILVKMEDLEKGNEGLKKQINEIEGILIDIKETAMSPQIRDSAVMDVMTNIEETALNISEALRKSMEDYRSMKGIDIPIKPLESEASKNEITDPMLKTYFEKYIKDSK